MKILCWFLMLLATSGLVLSGGQPKAETCSKHTLTSVIRTPDAQNRKIGYLEEAPIWTASQTLKRLLEENETLRITLMPGAFFCPGKGNRAGLEQAARALMARSDLDLVLVSGAQAASALLQVNNKRTPVLAFVIEDGEAIHILDEIRKLKAYNVSVRMDTGYARIGLQFFHYCTKFRKIGVFIQPGELDGPYSTVNTIIKIGAKAGFVVVPYELPLAETFEACQTGISRLRAQGIDAFYVGSQRCFDPEAGQIAALLEPLSQAGIPTFAREGADVVRQGAFMGNSSNDFTRRSVLLAQQLNRIFAGEQPYGIPLESQTIPRYSINLKVLESLGIDPPFTLLASCDEFFDSIADHNATPSEPIQP